MRSLSSLVACGAAAALCLTACGDDTKSSRDTTSPTDATSKGDAVDGSDGTNATDATAQDDEVASENHAPVAEVTAPAADVSIAVGATVTFTATCIDPDGDTLTHAWDFDGGAPDSAVASPGAITFATAGVFAVTYTCSDAHGLAADVITRTVTVTAPAFALDGTITYDKVRATNFGLDYNDIEARPARMIEVKLVAADDAEQVLASTSTDADGAYHLEWPGDGPSDVVLVAVARTTTPKITVADNTNEGAIYASSSDAIDATLTTTEDLHIESGWNGADAYTHRAAAPFAALDAAYAAAALFLSERAVVFPDLQIYWSADNAPVERGAEESEEAAMAAGHIGTSHWNGTALYILGLQDVDADEFDDHIIVHEWGHYFEHKLGRADSPGGDHGQGDTKDPRLAFGEGWGNALSGIVFAPDSVYVDTSGVGQVDAFTFDVDDNDADETPGWFSEVSVQATLYDVFDSGSDEAFDQLATGIGPIYDVMVGAQKHTPALTTLFSFIDALRHAVPADSAAIDLLTAHNGVMGVPVADAYGTGETNDGGDPANLPVFASFDEGSVELTFVGGPETNTRGQIRFVRLSGDGVSYTITSETSDDEDVDLAIVRDGVEVASARTEGGSERIEDFATEDGAEYVIIVSGLGTTEHYTSTISLEEGAP